MNELNVKNPKICRIADWHKRTKTVKEIDSDSLTNARIKTAGNTRGHFTIRRALTQYVATDNPHSLEAASYSAKLVFGDGKIPERMLNSNVKPYGMYMRTHGKFCKCSQGYPQGNEGNRHELPYSIIRDTKNWINEEKLERLGK